MKQLHCLIQKKSTPFLFLLIVYLTGVVIVQDVHAQHTPWTQKADMPEGRHSHVTITVDSLIYVIAGRYTDTLVSAYDPASDTWTSKSMEPIFRQLQSGAVVNGKIYMTGGIPWAFIPAATTVQVYDPVIDVWDTTITSMLTPRASHCTSVVDGKIYVIGGMTSGPSFWEGMRDTVEIYDPVTDSWSIGASMPTERAYFTTSVVDGKIYAIGGDLVTMEDISTVEMYDPVTNTWTTKSPMPTARAGHVASVVDGIIYIIGGGTHSASPPAFSTVEAYDPATDTWTTMADMPEKIALACASKIDGNIYVFGGISSFADPHLHGLETVYVYDLSKDLAGLLDQYQLDKTYTEAGSGSVDIIVGLKDPDGLTLYAVVETWDNVVIDSLPLLDDGGHNDGAAGDNFYANTWPVSQEEEQQYLVNLHMTKTGEDTILHWIENKLSFTTVGPLVVGGYTLSDTDTEPNPGDRIRFKLSLTNESTSATATNIKVKITCSDPRVEVTSGDQYFQDIEAGSSKNSNSYFVVDIAEDCPTGAVIEFNVDIASNGYSFWSDQFSITVMEEVPEMEDVTFGSKITVCPNPVKDEVTIEFGDNFSGNADVVICDLSGKILFRDSRPEQFTDHYSIDLSFLREGIYFIKICTTDEVIIKQLVKVE